VTGIGVQQAGALFYKANTDLFTASTTFAQAKTYTEQAATALGYSSASVSQAWQAVGVGMTAPSTALTNGVALTGLSLSGNNETCNIAAKTTTGRFHVMLRGYSSYSSTSLKGSYTP
jgi:vibriolysin